MLILLHLATVLCIVAPYNPLLPADPTSMALDGRFLKVFFSHQCSDTWECCGDAHPDRYRFVVAVNHYKFPPEDGTASSMPTSILGPTITFACKDLEVDTEQRSNAVEIRYSYVLVCDDNEVVSIEMKEYHYISNRPGRATLSFRGERGYCVPRNPTQTIRTSGYRIPSWAQRFFNPVRSYEQRGYVETSDGMLTGLGLVWGYHLLGRMPSNPSSDSPHGSHARLQSSNAKVLTMETGPWICKDTMASLKPSWQVNGPKSIGGHS